MVLEDMELLWKELWDVWDLRAFIILSLLLQTFLTLFASLRKRMPNNSIIIPLWSAYLLADWAANVAVGLISNSKGNTSGGAGDNEDLLAFWATFLMVHLGGPDTITAFALEDNELWLRHLLALIVQSLAALYLFLQSLPGNKLYIPTMLMFLVGIIKYSERVRSLYLASLGSLRDSIQRDPDPGADYAMIMDEYMNNEINQIQVQIDEDPDKVIESDDEEAYNCALTELQMIQHAYHYFNISKGFIVDSILNIDQRSQSQQLFRITSPEQASRVIEVELSFMYEFLYTKVKVVHCKLGYFCRFVSFTSVFVALVLFCSENKQGYNGFDVGITYVLLLGAIVLDIIAIIMLLFSNWTIIALSNKLPAGIKSDGKSLRAKILGFLLTFKRGGWSEETAKFGPSCLLPLRQLLHRCWSESFLQYNLIDYCIHKRSRWMQKLTAIFHLTNILDRLKYVRRASFTRELRDFIFKEMQIKAREGSCLEIAKEIWSARGERVLCDQSYSNLHPYVKVEYDKSVLLWHIATELCYTADESIAGKGRVGRYRDFSKLLSDYMLYLLVMQLPTMSTVAGGGYLRFIDTCAETKKFIQRKGFSAQGYGQKQAWPNIFAAAKKFFGIGKSEGKEHSTVCKNILSFPTDIDPATIKGNKSKSVLFEACRLAKELQKLPESRKWETMSKVWVELLSYGASRCGAYSHVQQLNKGGDLITLVWLLMVHLGFGDQFDKSADASKTEKAIPGK